MNEHRIWPTRLDDEDGEDEETEEKGHRQRLSPIAMDLLKKERTVVLSEEITPKTTQRVFSSLLWLDAQSQDPIRVYINTPGGSADDGFALYDSLRFVRAPVYCVTFGLNASAGILVLLAAPKERRVALPNARLMMHQPSGGGRGAASDIEITAGEIIKLRERANHLIAEATQQPFDQVMRDTDRDKWLGAQEALEYGLVGRVVEHHDEVIG